MPYGSVTAQGLFKLADINMENRRMEKQDEQQKVENQFRLGQEQRAQKAFDLSLPTAELQAAQAKENLQLLNTRKELETELTKSMTGTAPGEAFNVGWSTLDTMKQNPKYAPVVRKMQEELLQHQFEFIGELDKRDPSKKLSTIAFNQSVGKIWGFNLQNIEEGKKGDRLMGEAKNPVTQEMEPAYMIVPNDGTAPSGPHFLSGFEPTGSGKKASEGSQLSKLIAERDKYPVGSQDRKIYENMIAKETTREAKTGTDGILPEYKQERELRNDFIGQSKDFLLVRDAYSRIKASAKDPSAAGDLSLIFNYMKVLDPGSTVREGEFATAQNSAGVPGRVVSAYNKVISGERLNTEQRADFVGRSAKLYGSMEQQHKKRESEFKRLAKNSGLNPSNVIQDIGLAGVETPPETTIVPFEGARTEARKAADGFYYVEKNGKFFKYTPEAK